MPQVAPNLPEFKDISKEVWRKYLFPDGSEVLINDPDGLYVSKSGGHQVLTRDGVVHYIPNRWIELTWYNEKDSPRSHF
jgi:hypothetical protein